jgi:hypothetical protein
MSEIAILGLTTTTLKTIVRGWRRGRVADAAGGGVWCRVVSDAMRRARHDTRHPRRPAPVRGQSRHPRTLDGQTDDDGTRAAAGWWVGKE